MVADMLRPDEANRTPSQAAPGSGRDHQRTPWHVDLLPARPVRGNAPRRDRAGTHSWRIDPGNRPAQTRGERAGFHARAGQRAELTAAKVSAGTPQRPHTHSTR